MFVTIQREALKALSSRSELSDENQKLGKMHHFNFLILIFSCREMGQNEHTELLQIFLL